jgi:hypothetical protein
MDRTSEKSRDVIAPEFIRAIADEIRASFKRNNPDALIADGYDERTTVDGRFDLKVVAFDLICLISSRLNLSVETSPGRLD